MDTNTFSSDRRIQGVSELETLIFDDHGLIPVVAQDVATGNVLMVAWANRDALEQTLATGTMHYWSRSRGALWRKGETSGNFQALVSLHADCDGDTVLARVSPSGPACHTGDPTCFGKAATGEPVDGKGEESVIGSEGGMRGEEILDELWRVLESRDRERPEGSYTTRLLTEENLRLKKLGEEGAELIASLVRGDGRMEEEAADLLYHILVALKGAGGSWTEVKRELRRRRR